MEPQDREETYLANAAGEDVQLPSCPWDRKEAYLADIGDRIDGIEEDVETLKNNPDVVDIVDTYAELQAYDKTKLTDNDIIRVLNDERHDGKSTYYRYSAATEQFTYIGTTKQYTDFVGTDGTTAGQAGLVPAPATTDAGKFLKADGTWDDAGSSVNVVQTTGTSTTDVMSQKATTDMVFSGDRNRKRVNIGSYPGILAESQTTVDGDVCIASYKVLNLSGQKIVAISTQWDNASGSGVGIRATVDGSSSGTIINGSASNSSSAVVIKGSASRSSSAVVINGSASGAQNSIAVGDNASARARGAIALGKGASATSVGEMNIGADLTEDGYNNTRYRLLTGLYDGQSAHDAATVGQLPATLTNSQFNSILETA